MIYKSINAVFNTRYSWSHGN